MLNKALKWVYDNRDFFNPLFDNTDLYIKKCLQNFNWFYF